MPWNPFHNPIWPCLPYSYVTTGSSTGAKVVNSADKGLSALYFSDLIQNGYQSINPQSHFPLLKKHLKKLHLFFLTSRKTQFNEFTSTKSLSLENVCYSPRNTLSSQRTSVKMQQEFRILMQCESHNNSQ